MLKAVWQRLLPRKSLRLRLRHQQQLPLCGAAHQLSLQWQTLQEKGTQPLQRLELRLVQPLPPRPVPQPRPLPTLPLLRRPRPAALQQLPLRPARAQYR